MVPGKAEQESTPLKKDENDQSIDVQEDMTGFTDIIYLYHFCNVKPWLKWFLIFFSNELFIGQMIEI